MALGNQRELSIAAALLWGTDPAGVLLCGGGGTPYSHSPPLPQRELLSIPRHSHPFRWPVYINTEVRVHLAVMHQVCLGLLS